MLLAERRGVVPVQDYVDRLVACGMNLADAYEVCDDFIFDGDFEGLACYVQAVEKEMKKREAAG